MNAAAKHTPGPWSLIDAAGDADLPHAYQMAISAGDYEERDHYLATVVSGDPDELLANARLIAAAPDLLAACLKAYRLLDSVAFVAHEGDTHKPLDALRAAITNATRAVA